MSKIAIGYNNYADTAILSSGIWQSAPRALDNLKDYRLGKYAATASTQVGTTGLQIDLGSPKHVGIIGLVATNLSVDAQFRISCYENATFTTGSYDSGFIPLYPDGTAPFGSIPWGAPNWWTGLPSLEELSRFQRNLMHVLPDSVYTQYALIELVDPANTDGFLRAGRLFIGDKFEPENVPEYGDLEFQLSTNSTVVHSKGGTPYSVKERPDYMIATGFKSLSEIEAMQGQDILTLADIYGEVVVLWDSDSPAFSYRKQVFGRLKQLDPISFPQYANCALSFQVEGRL